MANKSQLVILILLLGTTADAAETTIKRQRPGVEAGEQPAQQQVYNRGALERPSSNLSRDKISIPDRWRLIETLGIV